MYINCLVKYTNNPFWNNSARQLLEGLIGFF